MVVVACCSFVTFDLLVTVRGWPKQAPTSEARAWPLAVWDIEPWQGVTTYHRVLYLQRFEHLDFGFSPWLGNKAGDKS